MASLIESYFAEFEDALKLPSAWKVRILAEVTEHLQESLSEEQKRGFEVEEATRRVIQRFGSAKDVANGFLLDSVISGTYTAGKALLLTEVALITFSFLRAQTLPHGPWSHDILPAQLTLFVNSATLAFLFAFLTSLFVCWQLWLYRNCPLPERILPFILGAILFNTLALLADGICYSIFLFQRAAVVLHSPSSLVLSLLVAIEISIILVGSFFVIQAVIRYVMLRKAQIG